MTKITRITAATCALAARLPTTLCRRRWVGAWAHRVRPPPPMRHVSGNQARAARPCSVVLFADATYLNAATYVFSGRLGRRRLG